MHFQQGVTKLIRELTDNLRQGIQQQFQHLDASINGLAGRGPPNRYESPQPRQRTRDGKPICFDCGNTGDIQQSCPYRRTRPMQNALPTSEPQRRMQQRNNSYNPGYQSGQRQLPSCGQGLLAAFEGVACEEGNYEHYLEDYDVGELYYYHTNSRVLDEAEKIGEHFFRIPRQGGT